MPTGYTAGVSDGSIKSFKEFALTCARAFGACITLRDEPFGSEIPEFTPSDYHEKELARCQRERDELLALSDSEKEQRCIEFNNKALKDWIDRKERNDQIKSRYTEMLEQAESFPAPTSDHQGLKDFMIQQLKSSIDFDCGEEDQPASLSVNEWFEKQRDHLNWMISHHQKEHQQEIQRTKDRNEWVQKLRDALDLYEVC